jgi:adenylate kinase
MYVVLLGAPGAGKGTQAPILASALGGLHLSTGDMLRAAVREGSSTGERARDYMSRGELVPDDVVLEMVMDRLQEPDAPVSIVLDGFPRNVRQARVLDRAVRDAGKSIDRAIYIRVPRQVLIERLSGRWTCSNCQAIYHELNKPPTVAGVCDRCGAELRQRPDDRQEAVARRLQVYMDETVPLLDYYREKGILREVDGDQGLESVTGALLSALEHGQTTAPT